MKFSPGLTVGIHKQSPFSLKDTIEDAILAVHPKMQFRLNTDPKAYAAEVGYHELFRYVINKGISTLIIAEALTSTKSKRTNSVDAVRNIQDQLLRCPGGLDLRMQGLIIADSEYAWSQTEDGRTLNDLKNLATEADIILVSAPRNEIHQRIQEALKTLNPRSQREKNMADW